MVYAVKGLVFRYIVDGLYLGPKLLLGTPVDPK